MSNPLYCCNYQGQTDRQVGLPFNFRGKFRLQLWLCLALCLCAPATSIYASDQAVEEFRGLWVVRHRLSSQEQIAHAVETAVNSRVNALLIQVRGRGDAYYRSRLVPAAEELGTPGFDPLAEAIQEARRAGLEVHAWINIFLTWHPGERLPESSSHIFLRHPEWFMRSADGIELGRVDLDGVDLVKRGVEGRYLSPGIPEVRTHLLQIIEEIVRNYDIDGVHLDYVRYPNMHYDYNLISRAEFARRFQFDPADLIGKASDTNLQRKLTAWEKWRADQVSLLVAEIQKMLARVKPRVKLSAAVKPDIETAYRQHGQDWIRWINQQMVDFVVPMFYTGSTAEISDRISAARRYVKKGHLYAGIGLYNQASGETVEQVEIARSLGLNGVVLYSLDSLLEQQDLPDNLRNGPFQKPSRVPHMTWKQEGKGAKTKTR